MDDSEQLPVRYDTMTDPAQGLGGVPPLYYGSLSAFVTAVGEATIQASAAAMQVDAAQRRDE